VRNVFQKLGYAIPKWIVVQEMLQMRVLNVYIRLANLLSTLAIIKDVSFWIMFAMVKMTASIVLMKKIV
jgi:hypothetical protein